MKLILLTGLDGSGKSSLLNKLEETSNSNTIAFIRVPKIDGELFIKNTSLYKVICFINKMHIDADYLKQPQLKVIALFSAMLIFKDLLNELNNDHTDFIFCERHPLIDTGVYAKFYIGKMDPNSLPKELIAEIDIKYSLEIKYLLERIGLVEGSISAFLNFIHNQFTVNKKYSIIHLQELFGIQLPDKIFYLSANPKILMQRLLDREILEAHESVDVFKKLIPVYESVLKESGVEITYINANNFENLNIAFKELKEIYF